MATVSDQVGAIAIIDGLRYEQMRIQENLDLPARRQAVAAKIREYYSANGIVVDEELVEAGVRKYFESRLRFSMPLLSRPRKILTDSMIFIEKTLREKSTEIIFATSVLMIGAMFTGAAVYGFFAFRDASFINHVVEPAQRLQNDVARNVSNVENLLATEAVKGSPLLTASGNEIRKDYEAIRQGLQTEVIDTANEAGVQPEAVNKYKLREDRFKFYEERYVQIAYKAQSFENLSIQLSSYQWLKGDDIKEDFAFIKSKIPALTRMEALVDDGIYRSDSLSPAKIEDVTGALFYMGSFANTVPLLAKHLRGFEEIGSWTFDEKLLKSILFQINKSVDNRHNQETAALNSQLETLLAFVKEPLTISIVSRPGEKTGLIRTPNDFADSKGVAYLVVEALDAAGNPFRISIFDAEDSKTYTVDMFAVRVSHEEFERVKEDKMLDGLVDNPVIGGKPSNSFTLKFDKRVGDKPSMISKVY